MPLASIFKEKMMKEKIDVFESAPLILKSLRRGILLTTSNGAKLNTMVIGWGSLGIDWSLPVFIVYIRKGRFTKSCLDAIPEFTINVPTGSLDKRILSIAGTKSGRDLDKFEALGLHLEDPEVITVPGIRELPLTLECKVIYKQDQNPKVIPDDIKGKFYPSDVDGSFHGANRDYHTAYYGQIVAAYIIK